MSYGVRRNGKELIQGRSKGGVTKWKPAPPRTVTNTRLLTHISNFDFKIEYLTAANNLLADYLLRIHEGTLGLLDISLKDPTIDYDSLELPDPTQPLQINTSYASSTHFSIESDDSMYHSGEAQTTPTLTSYYPSGNSLDNYARGICHHRGEHISEPKLPE